MPPHPAVPRTRRTAAPRFGKGAGPEPGRSAARAQLWDLVNTLATAKPQPILRVALYEFGNDRLAAETGWAEVAQAADGTYAAIDQDRRFAVATPVDGRLTELGTLLNDTYVPFGAAGREGAANQVAQDANVAPSAAAQRAVAKSSGLYTNARWDLVNASRNRDCALADEPVAELPEEMRIMTPTERREHLERLGERRRRIQAEIQELAEEQCRFVDAERTKQGGKAGASLEAALRDSLTAQAEARGFTFERSKPATAK